MFVESARRSAATEMRELSPQLFSLLSSLVEESIGIHYGRDDLASFTDKVGVRMAEAGFESALDYYYYLRYDDPTGRELSALTDALVVGETYFFRELDALKGAIEHVIAPTIAARGRARVWHAACSTGEEPLSLAMLLADAGLLSKTTIVATDISERALERARSGERGPRSLRIVDPSVAATTERWLSRDGNRVKVSPAILETVSFQRLNVLDQAEVRKLGAFDVVFCRNVLIYFRDDVVRRVAANLAHAVAPGGRLVIGTSESLLRFGTIFHGEERGGVFFYRLEERR